MIRRRSQTLLVAILLDLLLPELPNSVHPVVLIGRWLALGERRAPGSDRARLLWGAGWLLGGIGLSVTIARAVQRPLLAQAALAHTLFAYRALDRAVGQVQAALERDDLPEARRLLSWHLVSRSTADLSEREVAAAAIESLAENLSDSLVAPLCCFALGGLPGLAAYRVSNTADAMWGYHSPRYEYLGKTAARCDDLLNLAPARLSAVLIALAAQLVAGSGGRAWQIARRDHGRTASPNAGWPMAAMAGALDTTLIKIDHYQLGDGVQPPDAALISQARRITRFVLGVIIAATLSGALAGTRERT